MTAADFDAWLPLWRGYQVFYKTDIAAGDHAHWSPGSGCSTPDEPMHVALAEVDGRAIGLVHYIEHRSCWTTGNYMYLQDLFVDPALRGGGVGRALIEHVYAEARRAAARACGG